MDLTPQSPSPPGPAGGYAQAAETAAQLRLFDPDGGLPRWLRLALRAWRLTVNADTSLAAWAVAAVMRDALTGYSTGVVKFGWDPAGRPCAVTHIRRGRHQFACCCGLMHSDEQAETSGWRYSGGTLSREGVGWGGLAYRLHDADRSAETA